MSFSDLSITSYSSVSPFKASPEHVQSRVAAGKSAVRLVLLSLLALLGTTLSAEAQIASRISGDVAGSARTPLNGSIHPLTARYTDTGHADNGQPLTAMTIYFSPSSSQQAALTTLLADQRTQGSRHYHRWLTPAQYEAQFGLAPSDLNAVTNWLQQQGFQIVSASPLAVKFSGTVQQVETAFDTRIDNYNVEGTLRRANATALSIPAALNGVVSGIRGVNEFRPKPHIRKALQPHYTYGTTDHFVAPGDFATIYDVNALYNEGYTGSGQTIAIVGQSSIEASDVANFRSAAGLPANAPTLTLVPNSGTSEAYSNDEEESDLDVEWSGAVAKNASINFIYVGNNQNYDVFDALQYAIEQKLAPVVSISYGGCEANWSATDVSSLTTLFEQANSQGQTIIATAGDNGAADCDEPTNPNEVVTQASDGLAVDFPGSSPYVTTIGGTEFYADNAAPSTYWNSSNGSGDSSALQYIPEEVWNDTSTQIGLEGSGGGVSTLFSKPSWQTGLGVPNDGRRDLPDISLNASPQHDGYVYCSSAADSTSCVSGFNNSKGQPDIAGGTSFGAPSFAAILTLINQKEGSTGQGNFNPSLYAAANADYSSAFHDVQQGSNAVPCVAGSVDCGSSGEIGYSAGVGYDLATGWGSIDVSNFTSAISGTTTTGSGASSSVVVTATTTTPTVGTSDSFTAVVTANSGSTPPTGTVQFQVDGANAGSAVALTTGGSTAADAAEASFSYIFTTSGAHVITANYSGDSVYSANTGSLSVTAATTSSGTQSFTLSATDASIAPGAVGTSAITLTPEGGFTGSVAFTVTSPANLANVCFQAIPSATVSGSTPVSATLTIDTNDRSCQSAAIRTRLQARADRDRSGSGPEIETGSILLSFILLGGPALRRRRAFWLAALLVIGLSAGLVGCGGSTSPNPSTATTSAATAPGTYTITVTGTDSAANLTSSTSFTLTIQ